MRYTKAKLLEWAEGAGHSLEVTLGGDHLAGTTADEAVLATA
ncbi:MULTISPECIES: hypothetical protein [Halomonadaceae]|nr:MULTISPECIES: hypothetical protein [Halomonas]